MNQKFIIVVRQRKDLCYSFIFGLQMNVRRSLERLTTRWANKGEGDVDFHNEFLSRLSHKLRAD